MDRKIWSVALSRAAQEPIEPRVAQIIGFLAKEYPNAQWLIQDIDGLGHELGALTQRMNNFGPFPMTHSELIHILNADGQVIELDAVLINNQEEYYRVVVRTGSSIDVIGKQGLVLPASVLGGYTELEEGLYM